eukprot:CAMPEP_0170300206 /NCGR_PEP_ID=MMETSP0116_2-20130129/50330_1 /TAXON_ID=400756 /ORGANISM="Durinskia baltica, Strain CSIRO CS-38" /LENGTH=84 /DNA_ID=CAMNT_0010551963 /DNA_START=21 /DNA_END=275 /DNA_ORIENTATION=+
MGACTGRGSSPRNTRDLTRPGLVVYVRHMAPPHDGRNGSSPLPPPAASSAAGGVGGARRAACAQGPTARKGGPPQLQATPTRSD